MKFIRKKLFSKIKQISHLISFYENEMSLFITLLEQIFNLCDIFASGTIEIESSISNEIICMKAFGTNLIFPA